MLICIGRSSHVSRVVHKLSEPRCCVNQWSYRRERRQRTITSNTLFSLLLERIQTSFSVHFAGYPNAMHAWKGCPNLGDSCESCNVTPNSEEGTPSLWLIGAACKFPLSRSQWSGSRKVLLAFSVKATMSSMLSAVYGRQSSNECVTLRAVTNYCSWSSS